MYNRIYTVTKCPGEKPIIHENKIWDYKELSAFVGGLIEFNEPMSELPNVFCYINEEGLLKNLPMNFTSETGRGFFVGPAIFFGGVDMEGESLPLTKEEADKIVEFLNEHDCNAEYKTEDLNLMPQIIPFDSVDALLNKMFDK